MLNKTSKGRILANLDGKLDRFKVPKCMLISVHQWMKNEQSVIKSIEKEFGEKILVVRSSASDEDDEFNSCAGEYDSVLNILSTDKNAIKSAVETVINSYLQKINHTHHF